jgi:charged multivesicular body protein 2A
MNVSTRLPLSLRLLWSLTSRTLQLLEWAFGKRITPAERLRKNQRMLDKTIRELDQVRVKLERQEKSLVTTIKTSAQKGQMSVAKIQAKDLVRTRRYVEKCYATRGQLQKISLRLQTYRTNEQMMQAMKGATVALGNMNRTMNLPQLQRITMEFERENDIMEQRQEMMDDAIDDAVDVEEEGDEIVNQVLDEIGVDLRQAVSATQWGWVVPPTTNFVVSRRLERCRLAYKQPQYPKAELLKLSVGGILGMMTCRHG